jgi:hypothetical protein
MPSNPIFKPAGFLRLAHIQSIDESTMTAKISFGIKSNTSSSDISLVPPDQQDSFAQLPISYLSAGGGFIGGGVSPGTPVVVGQVEGKSYWNIVSFLARDPGIHGKVKNKAITIPKLNPGEITIKANDDGKIKLGDDGIVIGEPVNSITFETTRKLFVNTFDAAYTLTQGSREITGTILRDRKPNLSFNSSIYRTFDPTYNDQLKEIGMDPVANIVISAYGSAARNPARIEKREVVFEYEDSAKVQSNDIELKLYNPNNTPIDTTNIINRRESRVDALSLSLVSPNYLMETIKGTVIDTFGNIVDLNRNIIPIGVEDNLKVSNIKTSLNQSSTNDNVYEEIKRAERRSLAYHFEINARKEVQGSGPPSVEVRDNFARDRSRFFFDIDKEGQIKLNVPASSSTGNIPLLTRYENYSTVNPDMDPNNQVVPDDYRDILIESFLNNQPIELVDDQSNQTGPIDRFSLDNPASPVYIGHGTVYHNIANTISTATSVSPYDPQENPTTTPIGSGSIPPLPDIVSKQIVIAGVNANGGGRSGSLNFDGSLEMNIGANDVDRQSLWLDTQGGTVANLGADNNGISVAASLDGHIFLQLGRTEDEINELNGENGFDETAITNMSAPKVFDLRVGDGLGNYTVFRIDQSGLSVSTQARMVFYSGGDMLFRSTGTIRIDGESVVIMDRDVIKDPGKGPIR